MADFNTQLEDLVKQGVITAQEQSNVQTAGFSSWAALASFTWQELRDVLKEKGITVDPVRGAELLVRAKANAAVSAGTTCHSSINR